MIERIKKYFQNYRVTKFRIQHITDKLLKDFIYNLFQKNKQRFSNITFFVNCILNDSVFKKCINCGKLLNQNQIKKNCRFCCYKCAFDNQDVKLRRQRTIFELYGVRNVSSNDEIKNKKKLTCLKHFGCEFASQSQQVKEKVKKTNLQRYGVEYCLQDKQFLDKMLKTNLQRYGTKNPNELQCIKNKIVNKNILKYGTNYSSQNEKIKLKTKKTNLQRYGVENVSKLDYIKIKKYNTNLQKYGSGCCLQSKFIMEKTRKTNLQRYGCQCACKSDKVKSKIKQTNLHKYGSVYLKQSNIIKSKIFESNYYKIVEKFKDYVIPMFSAQQYEGYNNKQIYKWKCVKCGSVFQQNIHTVKNDQFNMKIPVCRKCFPYIKGYSIFEKQLLKMIKQFYSGIFIQNSRIIINPYEIDIYLPEKKLGIQFDGLIWHSNKFKKDDFNLLNKTLLCQSQGIKLIHVFEDEWIYKRQFVQTMIKLNFQNVDLFNYAQKVENKYVFDRRYFSYLDFKDKKIQYIDPQKFYILNNKRINQNLDNLYYIYDCGKIVV